MKKLYTFWYFVSILNWFIALFNGKYEPLIVALLSGIMIGVFDISEKLCTNTK